MKYAHLPGGDILEKGLQDLRAQIRSKESLLVCIAAPRLILYGVEFPSRHIFDNIDLEHALYDLLCTEYGKQAYSCYNSLIAMIVSLENAMAVSTHGTRPSEV